jgi:hypothetical protein
MESGYIRKKYIIIGCVYLIRSNYEYVIGMDASDIRLVSNNVNALENGDLLFVSYDFSWCLEIRTNGDFLYCLSSRVSIVDIIKKWGLVRRTVGDLQ